MNIKALTFVSALLVLTLVLYLFGAFVGWQPNPALWAIEGRMMLGLMWLAGVISITGTTFYIARVYP